MHLGDEGFSFYMTIALHLTIKPSRLKVYGMAFVMTFTLVAILCVTMNAFQNAQIIYKALFVIITSAFFIFAILKKQRHAYQIRITSEGDVYIKAQHKRKSVDRHPWRKVILSSATTLWSRALFLTFSGEVKGKVSMCIFPDQLSKDEFRRLSVACRWLQARI